MFEAIDALAAWSDRANDQGTVMASQDQGGVSLPPDMSLTDDLDASSTPDEESDAAVRAFALVVPPQVSLLNRGGCVFVTAKEHAGEAGGAPGTLVYVKAACSEL